MPKFDKTISRSSQFWNGRAKSYDAAISDHDAQYDERLANLKQLIKPTDAVLDFGCASGEIALDLAPHVKTIEGIDPSAQMIELAQKKALEKQIKNASFLTADIFDPRLEPESFDAILALNVMHLVKDHHEIIHQAKALLKPGGMMFIETPCLGEYSWWKRQILKAASALHLAPVIHVYKFGEPEAELKAHNFQILGVQNVPDQDCRASIAAQKPTE